jgi:hypothetical protein
MKAFTSVSASMLSVLLLASPALAQPRLTAEVRAGGNAATEEFAAVDLESGVGFEIGIGVRVAPDLFVFGAWDWQQHGASAPLFGEAVDVEDTGYAFGLRYVAPVASRVKPWVRGGGLYNHVEIEDEDAGDLLADSEHTWGFEVGGGVEVALDDRWSLTPGVRYRRFEPTVRSGGTESSTTLSYFAFDVGIALKF